MTPTKKPEQLFDLFIHDLRSPLAVAAASVQNLLRHSERYGPVSDKQKQMLERIIRNIHKSQALLQEMIEIMRSEEGIFQREYFFLEPALRQALMDALETTLPQVHDQLLHASHPQGFQSLLETQGISYAISGRFCRSFFCHDQRKIQQVLRNLISNALKYRRTRIWISIDGDAEIFIQIRDDGQGILPEGQKRIFNRFVRLETEQTFEYSGLGLGLAGVKTLVEAMEGKIEFNSREGEGTVFSLTIPPLNRRKGIPMGKEKDSILNGKTILAVDDEPDILDILEEEINAEGRGCRISKATSFEQAKEYLAREPFDLVILDIMGVRGFDLLEEATQKGLPVAMLTAHALSPEALKKSIEKGARAYLPKEKLGEVVPFLEDILQYQSEESWNRLFGRLGGFFDQRFGQDWQEQDTRFWNSFSGKIGGRFDRVIIK
ncbi:MAG: ATP-binding protein [Thermodesulfobacteriota bacterium]